MHACIIHTYTHTHTHTHTLSLSLSLSLTHTHTHTSEPKVHGPRDVDVQNGADKHIQIALGELTRKAVKGHDAQED